MYISSNGASANSRQHMRLDQGVLWQRLPPCMICRRVFNSHWSQGKCHMGLQSGSSFISCHSSRPTGRCGREPRLQIRRQLVLGYFRFHLKYPSKLNLTYRGMGCQQQCKAELHQVWTFWLIVVLVLKCTWVTSLWIFSTVFCPMFVGL